MAAIFRNIFNENDVIFTNDNEVQLKHLLYINNHTEIRYIIAEKLGFEGLAKEFKKFMKKTYLTYDEFEIRYKLSTDLINKISFFYGKKALKYITQFL